MAVNVIPFNMPEPMEIPAHIVEALRAMPKNDAVKKAMELLLEIDAAETMIHHRLDDEGTWALGSVVSVNDARAAELSASLSGDTAGTALADKALEDRSALLVMGQVEEENENPLPQELSRFLLAGAQSGNIGFIYVLPLSGENGDRFGALTLIRSAAAGPLNHEQPNITEGLRRDLVSILEN